MLTTSDLLRLLVGLREVNDLDLVDDPSVLGLCGSERKPTVHRLAAIIDFIFAEFRYERSPEFLAKLAGKSDELRAMHVRLLTPERHKAAVQRLGSSLVAILETDEAYRLVAAEHHQQLDMLKAIILSIE